jgi:hypothetical protein
MGHPQICFPGSWIRVADDPIPVATVRNFEGLGGTGLDIRLPHYTEYIYTSSEAVSPNAVNECTNKTIEKQKVPEKEKWQCQETLDACKKKSSAKSESRDV